VIRFAPLTPLRRAALALFAVVLAAAPAQADPTRQTKGTFQDAFRQLEGEDWPTPTDYRNAAGAPGHRYWQQKVDYRIAVTLDEPRRTLTGRQQVTYTNNSPDALSYLWLLLDQNNYKRASLAERTRTVPNTPGKISFHEVSRTQRFKAWEGGHTFSAVTAADGTPLPYTVVDTLMRIDLPQPLASGASVSFNMDWSVALPETNVVDGRGGYECFTKPGEDGNCLFLAAQWFPRLAVYSDYEGWHNKAFLGSGEFTLEFGDYDVSITVPADHVVSSTGELANPDILTAAQRDRLARARTASAPVYVVTPEEAAAAERGRASGTRTWTFRARNVRDFAWASSRKFIWDAMGVKQDDAANPLVMAMSFFPKEARPLWDAYSTKSIAHTLDVYGEFAFPYPYPTAQSVNGPVGGMEYPMITFNGPRPVKDRKTGALTYTERAKTGLIGVVIHEVGHIWFPMAVNSDERQWTWLDEGINTFLQFQAEKQWDPKFPSRRGEPEDIVEYMVSQNQVPIMVQSDSLLQFGANSYAKPATALVILRETVLGRELFDKAFRDYAVRWRFKRPTPYDFFRTMEESSGVDLDWFWRGWFYSTEHVDIALDGVVQARLDTLDPDVEYRWRKAREEEKPPSLTAENNAREGERPVVERDPATRDFYDRTDRLAPTVREREKAAAAVAELDAEDRAALQVRDNFYHFTFRNVGGVVMPIPLRLTYTDGSSEFLTIPAEVWRRNQQRVVWQHVTAKTLASAELDPRREIADADRKNNRFPQAIEPVTLKLEGDEPAPNRMRDNDQAVTPDGLQTRPAPKPR
jgi:aminopeptidase N